MFRSVTTIASAAFAVAAFIGLSGTYRHRQRSPPAPMCISSAPQARVSGSLRRTGRRHGRRGLPVAAGTVGGGQEGRPHYDRRGGRLSRRGRAGEDGGVGEWLGFIGSVDAGSAALGKQYEAFVQRCPATKVVLAGYSQGAMVVHRNLEALQASPNLAAALLVADGDRLPEDPTLNLGTASGIPERGKGAAQDWPILAHAPAPLSPAMGARTISVCDLGDAVCDYNPDDEETSVAYARGVAIHTSYATT